MVYIVANTIVQFRLPTIPFPKFDGDFKKWKTFSDKFESLVHNDTPLYKIKKLHYLKYCLTGQALDVVSSLLSSEKTYTIVIEALKKKSQSQIVHSIISFKSYIRISSNNNAICC